MLTTSQNANRNYLAKVVKIKNLKKHPNADNLQIAVVDFQPVITDLKTKEGDICIYFPIECQINDAFISYINAFRQKTLNWNNKKSGFFDKNCRVRAVKLRGEKSMGFIIPAAKLEEFADITISENDIGKEFDTAGDIIICKKYIVPVREKIKKVRQKRKNIIKKTSRIIDNLINLHVETLQLRRNIYKFSPKDVVSISYKLHGTSAWISHTKSKDR